MDDDGKLNAYSNLDAIAFFVYLFAYLSNDLYVKCWIPLFNLPVVSRSPFRIVYLKFLLVVQSVFIGCLINDFIVQHAANSSAMPSLSKMFVGLICAMAELVYSTTGSFHATLMHTILSHFVPSTLSILLHLTRIRSTSSTPHFEILAMHTAALFVVLRSSAFLTVPVRTAVASLTSGSHISIDTDASTGDYLSTPAGHFLKGAVDDGSAIISESVSAITHTEDTPSGLYKSDSNWSAVYSSNSVNSMNSLASSYSSGSELAPAVTDHAVRATNSLLKSVRDVRGPSL
ncbi:hypothetical protein RvY_06832-2 [Ramazzottius varieornatus]|uniref:Transmembrane protein n=1 Tax=Ramazzottius varieornatus TaxID=947166 RepID=A0A1D1V0A0_RAMVA|nr:hypothetical protein RvY_06832-2 [Ramazzottius varieornatus]